MPLPDITKNPPAWEPNAIPSETGWRHPETNELLVSLIKGCHPDVTEDDEEIPVEEEQQEEVAEETEAAEEQPQKSKKGKKK
mgnify:CR=1 FL=1